MAKSSKNIRRQAAKGSTVDFCPFSSTSLWCLPTWFRKGDSASVFLTSRIIFLLSKRVMSGICIFRSNVWTYASDQFAQVSGQAEESVYFDSYRAATAGRTTLRCSWSPNTSNLLLVISISHSIIGLCIPTFRSLLFIQQNGVSLSGGEGVNCLDSIKWNLLRQGRHGCHISSLENFLLICIQMLYLAHMHPSINSSPALPRHFPCFPSLPPPSQSYHEPKITISAEQIIPSS